MSTIEGRPRQVRDLVAITAWLPAGSGAATAPGSGQGKRRLSWNSACHLDLALFSALS
jgi:hypothetical protein